MILKKETVYTKDPDNKKILVSREFDAALPKVWKAWTEPQLLDQWWAPKPWKANTVNMDFRKGGSWLYYMLGPEGERHYCRFDYTSVDTEKSFVGDEGFTDDKGKPNHELPWMNWETKFSTSPNGTKVTVDITFEKVEDLEKIVEMGFQEGFAMAHQNLDELLAN